ncbi:hypothetical protein R3W88_020772 [Solanum pinnatisectum]|uniref:SBP-type domain-containing protein n=1 Tax=Solanum pinnatisectum TaxID=50273 RepID=A0AAV9KN24_9SOLN|nr:hypothetical protein R3W88_020772 [Solanum pinnatisectum]
MANNDGGGGVVVQVMKHYCQVEKCEVDEDGAKKYHKRHKVCQVHAKAPIVLLAGLRQRFCQQCSKFHELSEFDGTKKSYRLHLDGHNNNQCRLINGEASPHKDMTFSSRNTIHNHTADISG